MTSLLIVFIICLFLSAFFSAAEMAFVSSSEFKLRQLADSQHPQAGKVLTLKENPQPFLISLLVGNNVVNIAATALLTYAFEAWFGLSSEWLVTGILTPLMIVFCEMVPKDYGRMHGQHFLLRYADLMRLFYRLFYWPASIVLRMIHALMEAAGIERGKSIFVSEKEFRLLIEESARIGVVEHHKKQLIDMILDFERIRVGAVLTPLEQVPKLSIDSTIRDVKALARQTKSQMVLVYEEIPSLIVGMVYVFDLLFEENEDERLKHFLRSPVFLPDDTSIEIAFLTLQQKRQSYAVVTDRQREVMGVVPIERLLAV
jgi:CBS domain containing-hemolysin-like protein